MRGVDNVRSGLTPQYTNARGRWTQASYPTGNGIPSFWVGIGGYPGSTMIVQAGADSNALAAGGTSRYEFWVEDYPLGTVWQAAPAVSGGNSVYVSVTYGGATSTAFLQNISTGQYTSVVFNTPYYDGTSADFIYEALGVPSYPYPSWGSTTFSTCVLGWRDSSGASGGGEFTAYNYRKMVMKYNGVIKAQPSTASMGGFTMTSY